MPDLPTPPKGIVRLKYESTSEAWNARYRRDGVNFSQLFSDSKYGSADSALAAAIEWRKNAEILFPPMNRREVSERKKRNNKSGTTGVYRSVQSYYKGKPLYYWFATWSPRLGKKAMKSFSVQKYGEEKAKELAIQARRQALETLSLDTERDNEKSSRDSETTRDVEIDAIFSKDIFGFEGTEKYEIHKRKERDRNLRQLKIDEFLAVHGDLFCEICSFSFEQRYGTMGRGLIEVHHLVPLAEMSENHQTKLEELMCVCSNCHLVLHNGDPTETLEKMRFIMGLRDTKKTNKAIHRSRGLGVS